MTDTGAHLIAHHSGEPYATTDWDVAIDDVAGTVTWSTDTFAVDEFANALRWGTMFTFWVDTSALPDDVTNRIGFFKPGSSADVTFGFPSSDIFSDGFESGNTNLWSNGG